MHLILTGATGLVGSGVLNQMLKSSAVSKISIISRRPVAMAEGHSKANVILHQDFTIYEQNLLEQLQDAQGCVFALGISTNAVNKDEYRRITFDFPLAAARAFASLSKPFNFVYVSGEGATTSPGMFTPLFGRVKGEAEASLPELPREYPSLRTYCVRPGAVDAANDADIHEYLPQRTFMQQVPGKVLLPPIRVLYAPMHSPTEHLGRVLIDLASGNGELLVGKGISGDGWTLNNAAIRRLAGLP